VFEQRDALELCEDIAFLSRCALRYSGTIAYLLYLSDSNNLVTAYALDNDDVTQLSAGFSSLTDIKTKIKARWLSDYSDVTTDRGELKGEHFLYYNGDIAKYGSIEENLDVFIYNIEELVQKTLDFYGYRWTSIWRTLRCSTVLTPTKVEALDIVSIGSDRFSDNTVRGLVQSSTYNTDGEMSFDILLASSDADSGGPQEDIGFWDGNGAVDTSPT